jgi:hypothetical protein
MFKLSDLSPRTVVSVWIIVAVYMVGLLVLRAVHSRERQAVLDKQLAWLADTTPSSQLTPALRAQRDSFVDSLKQLAARYGEAAKNSGQDVYVVGRSLPVPAVFVLGFGLFLGPALVALLMTVLWFRSRKIGVRAPGA